MADRFGLDVARRHPRLLLVAALLSLTLWGLVFWGLSWLVGQMVRG
ncbi:MAG TPA: hypothetical protein VNZ85_09670 [Caulobacter sp.]|nr:hypothetical protein [Caulobacter sp.]